MTQVPIWRFGSRWEPLSYWNPPQNENIPVPRKDDDDASLEARKQKSTDPITYPLFTGVMTLMAVMISVMWSSFSSSGLSAYDFIIDDPEHFSIICYLTLLLVYVWYVVHYYSVIWQSYYSLFEERENDTQDFLKYGFSIFFIGVFVLIFFPLYWPIGFLLMFALLALKKYRTMKAFCDAVDTYLHEKSVATNIDYASSEVPCEIVGMPLWARQLISARYLSVSFTRNFLVYGILFGVISFSALYYLPSNPRLAALTGSYAHQIVSGALLVIVFVFYLMKVVGGIRRLRNQIENGESQGFGLVQRPW